MEGRLQSLPVSTRFCSKLQTATNTLSNYDTVIITIVKKLRGTGPWWSLFSKSSSLYNRNYFGVGVSLSVCDCLSLSPESNICKLSPVRFVVTLAEATLRSLINIVKLIDCISNFSKGLGQNTFPHSNLPKNVEFYPWNIKQLRKEEHSQKDK